MKRFNIRKILEVLFTRISRFGRIWKNFKKSYLKKIRKNKIEDHLFYSFNDIYFSRNS